MTDHRLKRVNNYQVEILLTLALAMGVYVLPDALRLSAPLAVVVAGLFVGNRGRAFAMTEQTREHVDAFWELLDEILNVVLFLHRGGVLGPGPRSDGGQGHSKDRRQAGAPKSSTNKLK